MKSGLCSRILVYVTFDTITCDGSCQPNSMLYILTLYLPMFFYWLTVNQVFKTCSLPSAPWCSALLLLGELLSLRGFPLSILLFTNLHALCFALNHSHTFFSNYVGVDISDDFAIHPCKFIIVTFLYSAPTVCICLKQTLFLLLLFLILFNIFFL